MFFFVGFVISVAALVICPIIGLILSKDKHWKVGHHKEHEDPPIANGAIPDYSNKKDLGELLDNRETNIFRPWGGLFGD